MHHVPRIYIQPGDWIRCKHCLVNFPYLKRLQHRENCSFKCKMRRQPQQLGSYEQRENITSNKTNLMAESSSHIREKLPTATASVDVPIVDLTLSEDEIEPNFELPKHSTVQALEMLTATTNVNKIPANLLKCLKCEEYFFSREELRFHSKKFHTESKRVAERNTSNGTPSVAAAISEAEKFDVVKDKLSKAIQKPPESLRNAINSVVRHKFKDSISTHGGTVANITKKQDSKETEENIPPNKSSSVASTVENTLKETNSKVFKQTKKAKNYEANLEYYVQREAAKKKFQYSDHVCPYCKKDCSTAARWESHISSKHEQKSVRKRSHKRFEKSNATRKLIVNVIKKYTTNKKQCNQCSRWLARSALPYHILTHTGEKPFSCRYCDVQFRKNYLRAQHEVCCELKNKDSARSPVLNRNSHGNILNPLKKLHSKEIAISDRRSNIISVSRTRVDTDGGENNALQLHCMKRTTASDLHNQQSRKSIPVQRVSSDTVNEACLFSGAVKRPRVMNSPLTTINFYEHCTFSSAGPIESLKQSAVQQHSNTKGRNTEMNDDRKIHNKLKSPPKWRIKARADNLNVKRMKRAITRMACKDSLDNKISEHTSRPLREILADIDCEGDCAKSSNDITEIIQAPDETNSVVQKNNYRCLVCQEVVIGENNIRQHMRLRHGRIMQFVLKTEGNPAYDKRVVKLCKKVESFRKTGPNTRNSTKTTKHDESEVLPAASNHADEDCPRLIVTTKGTAVVSCALLTPPESVIINNDSVLGEKETEKKSLRCEFCTRSFQSQAVYLLHALEHKDFSVKNCVVCSKIFLHSQHFNQHMLTVHNCNLFAVENNMNTVVSNPGIEKSSAVDHDSEGLNNLSEVLNRQPSDTLSFKSNDVGSGVELAISQVEKCSSPDNCKKLPDNETCSAQNESCELVSNSALVLDLATVALKAKDIKVSDHLTWGSDFTQSDSLNYIPLVAPAVVIDRGHQNSEEKSEVPLESKSVIQSTRQKTVSNTLTERASVLRTVPHSKELLRTLSKSSNEEVHHNNQLCPTVSYSCVSKTSSSLQNETCTNSPVNAAYSLGVSGPDVSVPPSSAEWLSIPGLPESLSNGLPVSMLPVPVATFGECMPSTEAPSYPIYWEKDSSLPSIVESLPISKTITQTTSTVKESLYSNQDVTVWGLHLPSNGVTFEVPSQREVVVQHVPHREPMALSNSLDQPISISPSLHKRSQVSKFVPATLVNQTPINSSMHGTTLANPQGQIPTYWAPNLSMATRKNDVSYRFAGNSQPYAPAPHQGTALSFYNSRIRPDVASLSRNSRPRPRMPAASRLRDYISPLAVPSAYPNYGPQSQNLGSMSRDLHPTLLSSSSDSRSLQASTMGRYTIQALQNNRAQHPETIRPGQESCQSNFNSKPITKSKGNAIISNMPIPNIAPSLPFNKHYGNISSQHLPENATKNSVFNFVGGAILQKIPVASNIPHSGGNPHKKSNSRKSKVEHLNFHSTAPTKSTHSYSSSVVPLLNPIPSRPINSKSVNIVTDGITESMINYSPNQIVYQEGSKSKMFSRRQCPYCYLSYQSELALQDHISIYHADSVADNSQQSQLVITAIY